MALRMATETKNRIAADAAGDGAMEQGDGEGGSMWQKEGQRRRSRGAGSAGSRGLQQQDAGARSGSSAAGGSSCQCTVCGKLPFRGRTAIQSFAPYCLAGANEYLGDMGFGAAFNEAWDFEDGMYNVMFKTAAEEEVKADPEVARKASEKAVKYTKRLRTELAQAGLLHSENQNYSGLPTSARMMAPFDRDEIQFGPIIGSGGFSSVYEITSFRNDTEKSAELHPYEQAARAFLTDHAQKEVIETENGYRSADREEDDATHSGSSSSRRKRGKSAKKRTAPRYAIKHLKYSLMKGEGEKYERAAIDLALEAQLLLAMDHPNIVSIRGWTKSGPSAFSSGRHNDYFVIMDQLPETLEDRIFRWRKQYRKYRSRIKMLPWNKAKFANKLRGLLRERLGAMHDISKAMEYMHERRIMNRDLKTSNVGFDISGALKVFDFGLSRLLPPPEKNESNEKFLMSRVGTKYYMAPEVQKKEPYNLSADVYSFGVVLWEVLSMSTPSKIARSFKKKQKQIQKPHHEDEHSRDDENDGDDCWLPICGCWSGDLQSLVASCLQVDPDKRPTITEVRCSLSRAMQDLDIYKERRAASGDGAEAQVPRRRSTFRIDLSDMAAFCEEVLVSSCTHEQAESEACHSRHSRNDEGKRKESKTSITLDLDKEENGGESDHGCYSPEEDDESVQSAGKSFYLEEREEDDTCTALTSLISQQKQ